MYIHTFSDFSTVRNKVEEMGYVIDDAEIIKEAKVTKTLFRKGFRKGSICFGKNRGKR